MLAECSSEEHNRPKLDNNEVFQLYPNNERTENMNVSACTSIFATRNLRIVEDSYFVKTTNIQRFLQCAVD